MEYRARRLRHTEPNGSSPGGGRLVADGGTPESDDSDGGSPDSDDASDGEEEQGSAVDTDEPGTGGRGAEPDGEPRRASERDAKRDEERDVDRANVEVTDAGEGSPAEPRWEEPDLDEMPEFEIGGEHPTAGAGRRDSTTGDATEQDPTIGRPNDARSPGGTRITQEGTEGYIAALELCVRLPDDVRLPAEAADVVPAAVEAELEEDIQGFAAAEFDNPSPTVDALAFVERDDEVWLRLRLGVPPEAFADLDPDAIRAHALQELEGLF